MLVDKLTKTGIMVNHASGDAGLLIVLVTLKVAKDYHCSHTVLIGEDTDLLVLPLHHFLNEKLFTSQMNRNRASNQQKFGILVMQSKFWVKYAMAS